jgi:hypothetical protein
MKPPALLAFAALSLAPAAHAADLSGLWIVSTSFGPTPMVIDCSILQVGVALQGWCEPESAEAVPLTLSGAINQNSASWGYDTTVQGRPVRLTYQGAVSADQTAITGQLAYGTSPPAGLSAVRK